MSEGRSRCSLGELFEIENGFAFKSADFQAAGVPVIKIKNIKANHFAEGEHSFVSSRFTNERPNKVARRGDLLISMSGNRHDGSPETWVGKVAPFNHVGTFLINQRVGALRPKPHAALSTRYFGYLLSSWSFQEHFIAVATSSGGQANLSPSQILAVPVEYPTLPEQRAIAATLGALDDKIELNRKMNVALEAMARALFRDWFVDFGPTRAKMEARAPYLSPDLWSLFPDRLDDEGKPEGWELSNIGSKLRTMLGGTPSRKDMNLWGGHIPWINSGKANEFRVTQPSEYITQQGLERSATKLLPKRTTLIAITGATLGQVSLNEIETCANQSIVGILGSADHPGEFVYLWVQENIDSLVAAQTGGAQQHINKSNVDELSFLCPAPKVLSTWLDLAKPLFDQIASNCFESQTLAQTRDLLLPRLMSGELRVAALSPSNRETAA